MAGLVFATLLFLMVYVFGVFGPFQDFIEEALFIIVIIMIALAATTYLSYRKSKKIVVDEKTKEEIKKESDIERGLLRDGYFQLKRLVVEHEQTEKELKEKIEELQEFTRLTTGREVRMVELKEEINKLKKNLDDH